MSRKSLYMLLFAVILTVGAGAQNAQRPAGIEISRLDGIAPIVERDIQDKKLPGAVILIGRGSVVVYHKAFGNRAVEPAVEAMTEDTIFDVASLTKVVATTTAVMQLLEQGRIRLSDRVATFIPGFERYGKADITVRQLMTHTSGLRPDLDLSYPWEGYEKAIDLAIEEVPTSAPGEKFVYSDINYELLGEIVHRVSGVPLNEYAKQKIFDPLGMKDTMFLPPASLVPRIAPTEKCTPFGWPCEGPDLKMLRGVVHDPTARRMHGVAGHAGLFSTAADLSIFCRMLINKGRTDAGVEILSPMSVYKMTTPATPPDMENVRGLGWDMDSTFSSNRGELLPLGSFGHTGFTGTGIWIDPATNEFIVFMSNRVHPDGKGDVTPLRARVATIAAAAIWDPAGDIRAKGMNGHDFGPSGTAPARPPQRAVETGIDVLRADNFGLLRGKRVGLLTNHTGRARDGSSTIDLLFNAKDVKLVSLFSPEHGIRGILDASVPSEIDEKTKLPINSLYGATQRPTPEMLQGLDAFVVDLQDVGVRFYTYETALAYVLEEAAKRKLPVIVLDRPNPIGGWQIEGPALDKDQVSYVGYFAGEPVSSGMTMGELAQLFNAENRIGADLKVVTMKNWHRDEWFDETGQPWINPSPNMRNMNEAALYPGIGMIEGTNISVGRGTDTPFEHIGAPWIGGLQLADYLNARNISGVRFYPVRFTPSSSKYANEECEGVFIVVADRSALHPVRVGLEIAAGLNKLYPGKYTLEPGMRLIGSRDTLTRIAAGQDPAAIAASWSQAEQRWRALRAKYLLY